jgi:hypothetical protein
LTGFTDAFRQKDNSCDVDGNWLEVWPNDDTDARLASDAEDGYLYFRWRVEVTPIDAHLDENHQVKLARNLKSQFENMGAAAVICANFEDRL